MRIRYYKINLDEDVNGAFGKEISVPEEDEGLPVIDSSIYNMLFDGEIEDAETLNRVAIAINYLIECGYCSSPLFPSDVIEVIGTDNKNLKKGFYYANAEEFIPVDFDADKATKAEETIKAIIVEPGKSAYPSGIHYPEDTFEELVNGSYSVMDNGDGTCLVYSSTAMLKHRISPCRALYNSDDHNKVDDIIIGTFIVCGWEKQRFCSLTESLFDRYIKRFGNPERFYKLGSEIIAVPITPINC